MAEPTSPAPDSIFEYLLDVSTGREGKDRYTGLGFEDLPDNVSLATTSAYPSFSSQVSNDSRSVMSSQSQDSQDASWAEFSGPDLTFATSESSSAYSRVNTPADVSGMYPSISTESSRKTKSMMVLDGLSKDGTSHWPAPETGFLPSISSSSLRRLRAKTLSVSTSEKARTYRHKRHAIYGQQFSLSAGRDKHSLSTAPSTPDQGVDSDLLEPSPCILAVERKTAANSLFKKSSLVSSKRIVNFLDPKLRASPESQLFVPAGRPNAIHATVVHVVEPLKITRTRSKQLLQKLVRSSPQDRAGRGSVTVYRHPLIEDLDRQIDLAISEWRVVPYL